MKPLFCFAALGSVLFIILPPACDRRFMHKAPNAPRTLGPARLSGGWMKAVSRGLSRAGRGTFRSLNDISQLRASLAFWPGSD